MTWYVVAWEMAENPKDPGDAVWTVSEDPEETGWSTDAACPGYGLTRDKAQFLVDAANSDGATVIAENARLRSCLWALVQRAGGKVELTMADAFAAPLSPELVFYPAGFKSPLSVVIEAVPAEQGA